MLACKEDEKIFKETKEGLGRLLERAGPELYGAGIATINKLFLKDKKGEVVLLPYYFHKSLGEPWKDSAKGLLKGLGMANCLGWMAYSIYDDFLDSQGDTNLISFANWCLRELTGIINAVSKQKQELIKIYRRAMDMVDNANAWEINNCRMESKNDKVFIMPGKLPDYGNFEKLYERSWGHSIGSSIILYTLGYGLESKEQVLNSVFFKNYLIARQINDDLHDWEEDLAEGRLNCIGAEALKIYSGEKAGLEEINLSDNVTLDCLRTIVYKELLERYCTIILDCVEKAEFALVSNPAINDPDRIQFLLKPLESAAMEAWEQGKNALKFINSFSDI